MNQIPHSAWISYLEREGFDLNVDAFLGLCSIRKGDLGIKINLESKKFFSCPHCLLEGQKITEIKINGEPRYKSVAYGHGVADTVYGRAYFDYDGTSNVTDWPVSTKYRCENCSNEFTKPELLQKQIEHEKSVNVKNTAKIEDAVKKLSIAHEGSKRKESVTYGSIGCAQSISDETIQTMTYIKQ